MARRHSLGLDELMIVNPAPNYRSALLLGDDGILYEVQGSCLRQRTGTSRQEGGGMPYRFFLGEDGTLYEAVG